MKIYKALKGLIRLYKALKGLIRPLKPYKALESLIRPLRPPPERPPGLEKNKNTTPC